MEPLRRAFEEVVRRHEVLRTTYEADENGEPRQVVRPPASFALVPEAVTDEADALRVAREEAHAPFDLARGPVLRVRLLRLAPDDHVLLVTLHHIATDLWSSQVLQRELDALYAVFARGAPSPLQELPIQYADYALWQREQVESGALAPHLSHWEGRLAGLPVLDLPTDRARPAIQSHRGASTRATLPAHVAHALAALAEPEGATPFMAYVALWQALLSRYSGQPDLAIAAPVSGREQGETQDLVGFFVNTLVLRADLSDDPSFREHLRRARRACLDALAHQTAPFDLLVTRMRIERDTARPPLAQALLAFEDARSPAAMRALRFEPLDVPLDVAKMDVQLSVRLEASATRLQLDHDADLFDASTAERMLRHLVALAEAATRAPDERVSRLPILDARERAEALGSPASADFPRERVEALFARVASQTPDAVALSWPGGALTYGELDARANRLANLLASRGVRAGDLVGVAIDRSPSLVVALLATLKAGAAYVPLDPAYPPERLRAMASDARIAALVAREETALALGDAAAITVLLDRDAEALRAMPPTAPRAQGDADAAAYVMYTSGSTGAPKGVVVPHRAIARLVFGQEYVRFGPDETFFQYAPAAFDASTFEIWGALLHGARLALAPPGKLSAQELGDALREAGVTTLWLTAPLFHLMVDENPTGLATLRQLIAGGDVLSVPHVRRALRLFPRLRLVNGYGPTECTTFACCHAVREPVGARVPIGQPIAHTRALVLDAHGEPVPMGVAGELHLGGPGLALGYLHRDDLTTERFVTGPAGERVYRTGDLVRRLADGTLDFLGRIDRQVKVRGFRIEPGEVEAALVALPGVKAALVAPRETTAGHKQLVAYVVASEGAAADVAPLREALRARLPEHMVPSAIVPLDAFPLNANGKVDQARLPAVVAASAPGEAASLTPIEAALAEVWSDVLGVPTVRPQDNFFELGGDSILSIQVVARAARRGLRLTTRHVFQHQTLARLAAAAERVEAPALAEQGLVTGEAALTPIQRWFLDEPDPEPGRFDQSFLLRASPDVEPRHLAAATRTLLLHHDALRGTFARADGRWSHRIAGAEAAEGAFSHVDLSTLAPEAARAEMHARATEAGAFDLARGPLLRVVLFDLGAAGKRLLLVAHHLAVDGVSWRILLEDLETAYAASARGEAPRLPPKTTSWPAWAARVAERARSEDHDVDAWLDTLQGAPSLPRGRDVPDTFENARHLTFTLGADDTRLLLGEAHRAYRAQANDVLLTALAQAFHDWTGSGSLLVELEAHGREDERGADLSRTVGWFTTMHPLRLELPTPTDVVSSLKAVKERLRQTASRAATYGLARHVRDDEAARRLRAAPAPQVGFNHLGSFDGAFRGALFDGIVTDEPKGLDQAPGARRPHPLDVTSAVLDGELQVTLTYTHGRHGEDQMRRLADALRDRLRDLAAHVASPEVGGCTPSDFPHAGLDQAALDRLFPSADAREVEDVVPLTPLQEGMLFHALLEPGSSAYFEQLMLTLEGELDPRAFAQAWDDLVARHDALRTAFAWEGLARPAQVVRRAARVPVTTVDWRDAADPDARFRALQAEDRARGFDLSRAPLMRVTLVRVGERAWRVLWSFHHAILDGWSLPILVGDLLAFHDARARGAPLPPLPPAPRFAELAARLADVDAREGETFWRETLAGFTEPTRLPLVRETGRGDRAPGDVQTRLSEEETRALHQLARDERVTASTLVQAAWALTLARQARAGDVVFGATVAGRPPEWPGVERAVGLFINTVPVRARVPEDESVRGWLRALQDAQARAKPHEQHALTAVQGWSEVPRGVPLFDTLVVFENYPVPAAAPRAGVRIVDVSAAERTNYPVTVVAGGAGALILKIAYDAGRVAGADAARLLARLRAALVAMTQRPDARVGDIHALDEADETQLRELREGPVVAFDERPVHQQAAERARDSPARVALAQGARTVTYGELDARADALARALCARGVRAGDLVAVLAQRSPEAVIGALAAMKAGGAYLPLDPAHPDGRLASMIEDARPAAVLATRALASRAPPHALILDEAPPESDAALPTTSAAAAAYVIYTSGSTGAPKGVVVPHRALSNLCAWHVATYGVGPGERASHLAGLSFDASVWEVWPTLVAGATLVLPEREETRLDPEQLRAWLRAERIGVAFAPTPMAERLLDLSWDAPVSLRWLLTGGDALRRAPTRVLPFRVANHYGPTEAAVLATACEVAPDGAAAPPIGRPIPNARVLLLDPRGRPVAPGVPGEICLGGANLALGYLRRDALTAERFVADAQGARLYRTGDLARWRDDGQLEFLGRLDQQVKIRGVRVEPGEVEAAILREPGVASCVVDAPSDARGERRLVAYVVGACDVAELRASLASVLPDAMVPSAFVRLDALPLTPNGKVDRKALPAPEAVASRGAELPATPSEELLATLWADALGRAPMRDDDFFAMGGHSLVATRLVSRVRTAFHVELPLRALFEAPTLRELAARIDALRSGPRAVLAPVVRAPRDAPLPLTSAQQRLWFLHAWEPESALYNIPAALRARGALDVGALETALRGVVARHEVLRTTYALVDGAPVQRIHPEPDLALPLVDLQGFDASAREAEALRLAREDATAPFDLARAPPLRARLLRLAPDDHVLLLNVHHIAFDGWSLGILVRELGEIYAARVEGRAPALPALAAQVADLALAEPTEEIERDLTYWRGRLAGVPPLDLPTDRPRPPARTFRGAQHRFALSARLVAKLRAWSRQAGATEFMTLLAAFQALLARHSGQRDFAVGSPVAGRHRPESEPLIGFFVNTLVLRADLEGDPSFREMVARTRATCLDAYAHERVPFERLVGELAPARDLARSPLFQAMLAFTRAEPAPSWAGVAWESIPVENGTSKFDVTFALHDTGQSIEGLVEYALDLFDDATAAALARRFAVLLDAALDDPDRPLSRLPLVTDAERAQLLARALATDATPFPAWTLHGRFAQVARERASSVAVVSGDERLTYAQLDARADQLAARLRARGIGRGALVGLCVERSADVVVGILGILKAGAAYVPLDPAYPAERLAFMVEDSGARLVVTQTRLAERVPPAAPTLLLDEPQPHPQLQAEPEPSHPDDLAYVIYTSGSTGTPKGVMVEHRHVARLLTATQPWFRFDDRDVWTLFHSYAFDFSVWEMWGALLHGGRLVVLPHEVARSPDAFHALLRAERVTVLNQTPSAWRQLMAADERAGGAAQDLALRYVVFGGEALETASLRGWFARHGDAQPRLVNMYGITETTVHVTYRPLTRADAERGDISPLGAPIPDLDVFLLDERGEPVPEGVPGEIVVGGAGVARGYLHRPEIDRARFVPDPRRPGARLYRSGDLARWLPGGDIAYMGRMDTQVKIRGFRIELGEIEAALLRHDDVAEACVVAREDAPGDKRLVAYVVARTREPAASELRAFLRAGLPEHMVPAAFVALPALPLTTNGKVDRRALPAPTRERPAESAFVPPATPVEARLAEAWAEALGLARIGRHDNFFEMGGDSLLSVKAAVAASARGLAVKPRMIFEGQTVAELAAALGAPEEEARTLVAVKPQGSRAPLFFVHPAGGTVGCYVRLARALHPEQPFYALQAVGTDDDRAPHETIEEMARAYLRDVRRLQPAGPYRLGGWSYGGTIAFEMARQLEAAGERVDVLAMLDPGLPPPEMDLEAVRALQKRCEALAEEARLRPADEAEVARVRADLTSLLAHVGAPAELAEVGLEGLRRYLRVFDAEIRAGWAYAPKPYGGAVTLLLTEQALALAPRFAESWRPLVRELRAVQVRGSHWTALLDPQEIALLAARLDAALAMPEPSR